MKETHRLWAYAALPLCGLAVLLAAPTPAAALSVVDTEKFSLDLGGDIKGRFSATFPYEHLLMPDEPIGQAALLGRARLELSIAGFLHISAHHQMAADIISGSLPLSSAMLGDPTAAGSPEALPLSWSAYDDSSGFSLRGRMDRLSLRLRFAHMDLKVGRQPVSFGSAWFFTPLDLVNPFHPATVDSEYKPGVDAARLDAYPSASTEVTLVAAYAGDWTREEMVFAGHGQLTVGVTDLGVFLGEVRGDRVAGLSGVGSIGPVGVYGDVAATLPGDSEEDPFVRVVLGADHRATATTSVGLEIYYQSLGASSPSDYGEFGASDRVARGELWTLGRVYGGLSVLQEITPLVMVSVAGLANLADQSALVMPSVSVSVAENTDAVLGGYLGVGERPHELEMEEWLSGDQGIESEFGLLPSMFFAQMRAYF